MNQFRKFDRSFLPLPQDGEHWWSIWYYLLVERILWILLSLVCGFPVYIHHGKFLLFKLSLLYHVQVVRCQYGWYCSCPTLFLTTTAVPFLLLAIYDCSVHFTENFTPDKLALPECSTNGYWIVLPFLPINALISCYSSNDRNKDLFIICKKCRVKKICFSPPPYLPGFIDLFHSTTRYIWNSFVVSHKAMTLLLWTKHKNSNKQF